MFVQLLEEVVDWLFSPPCVLVRRNVPRRCVEGHGSTRSHEIPVGEVGKLVGFPSWETGEHKPTAPKAVRNSRLRLTYYVT